MDLDEFEDRLLGNYSHYKIFIVISCAACIFATAITSQTAVYYNAVQNHRCALPYLDNTELPDNVSRDNVTSLVIPPGDSCHQYIINSTECLMTGSLSCITNSSKVGIINCNNGYYYDSTYFKETVASEWDLVCDRSILNTIAKSLFFIGIVFGSPPAGYLVDWFGRKRALLILSFGFLGSGIGCAFSPSFTIYCVFRFLEGATSVPLYGAVYSYVNEVSNGKLRSVVGILMMVSTAACHTVFPIIAYFIRDWRLLNLTCGLLILGFIVTWPFLPESPSWLLMKGREKHARKVLDRYAKNCRKTINDEDWKQVLYTERKKMESVNTRSHLTDLFRRPYTRILTLVVLFDWFAINCVFYGLVLNVGSLLGDPYLNGALNGATEIVAIVIYSIMKTKYGDKCCLLHGMLCAGSFCLIAFIFGKIDFISEDISQQVVRWTSIIGKLFATLSFFAIYQYTNDIYPTITRGKAMALSSTCARIGSIIIPFILYAQSGSIWITQIVFGVLGLSAGLATLIIPTTSSKSLTTTLQEAEKSYRNGMKRTAKFIKKHTEATKDKEGKKDAKYHTIELPGVV